MQQTVSYDPDSDSPAAVALAVAWSFGLDTVEDLALLAESETEDGNESSATAQKAEAPQAWKLPKMRRYVKALQPRAREVLGAIAEAAPAVPITSVQRAVGLDGSGFAGTMSSFGFAARNTRGVHERPFTKYQGKYHIDEYVAKQALAVLDELGGR
jgi:hypothetical protein